MYFDTIQPLYSFEDKNDTDILLQIFNMSIILILKTIKRLDCIKKTWWLI